MSLDLNRAREIFDASTDFTVGIEEEFAILDPDSYDLTPGYERLSALATTDDVLQVAVAGELISSEIEIRSGRGENFGHAVALQAEARRRLFALAAGEQFLLGANGVHPWSRWQDQHIIDTEHYHRVADGLRYVAWRNNTFGLHVHVGVNGADRAIAVSDRIRSVLPELLAISASSPFVEGVDSGLHSARTQLFTRNFPRCGVPEAWGDFAKYAEFVELLKRTGSIIESTQLWWSVRPHHLHGTVEVRICDAQPDAADSTAITGLIVACVAQAALEYDDNLLPPPVPNRLIEENLWRAIRSGLEGRMIDFDSGTEYSSDEVPDRLLAWTKPARTELGIEPELPRLDSAQHQRASGEIRESFVRSVGLTQRSYASDSVLTS